MFNALRHVILLRGLRARKTKMNAFKGKQLVYGVVIKFTTIVILKGLNFTFKSDINKITKQHKLKQNIRFIKQQINPQIMIIMIQKQDIIFKTNKIRDWESPQVRVNDIKSRPNNSSRTRKGKPHVFAKLTSMTNRGRLRFIANDEKK